MSDSVDCPYCGAENEMHSDYWESSNEFDHECDECGKEFEVLVEFDPCYSASKITYEICRGCGKEFRYEGKSYPQPNKYEHLKKEEYIICSSCYAKAIFEDYK